MQWTVLRTRLIWIVFVSLITFALGEEFFHSRNREDNVNYRTMEDKNIVTSTEKAEWAESASYCYTLRTWWNIQ
ncbi:hypothetical protein CEXT_359521 [Caerostris extrusa]|uniref:Uncharacterized protein n=1 Tax=Caerostris extrusa TaxID=172846 RepID=A0AAV4XFB3_CAEEX|nr:hypothetical protein CEXT_359521 [Caerostris extrusa]